MMAQLIYPLTFFLFFLASNRSQPVEFCVLFFSLEEQVVKYAPRMSVAANIGRFSLAQIRNGHVLPVKHSSHLSLSFLGERGFSISVDLSLTASPPLV